MKQLKEYFLGPASETGTTGEVFLTKRRFLVLATMLAAIYFFGLDHGLWRRAEVRDVEIGREMYLSGNWAVPTFNGETFLEKPPLFFASVALSFKIFGRVSENLARIPSTLWALLGLLAVMLLGRRIGGYRVALIAGLVLSTNSIYFIQAHQGSLDMPLAVFVSLCLFYFYRLQEEGKDRYTVLEVLPMYAFAVLAFYTKGFIGLVFPGLAIVVYLLWRRDPAGLWRIRPITGALVFLVMTAPWFLELWRLGGSEYLKVFFIDNHYYRFIKTPPADIDLGHHTVWYWYFEIFWKMFNPWGIFTVPAALLMFTPAFKRSFSANSRILLLAWYISGFVFLTVSSTKREVYLLPILPPMALAVAVWIDHRAFVEPSPRWEQFFPTLFGFLMLALSFILPIYCATSPAAGASWWALGFIPVSLLLSGPAIYFLFTHQWARFYPLALGAAGILALTAAMFYLPLDPLGEDASHFPASIKETVAPCKVVYALDPNKRENGYINFYTGKNIVDLDHVEDLAELAKSPDPIMIVLIAGRPRAVEMFPDYVKSRGARVELIVSEPIYDRVSALWRLRPAP